MEHATQEQEVMNVIEGLHESLAKAKKLLEEIRKPKKAPLKHGDIGHTVNEPHNKRVFMSTFQGIVGHTQSRGVTITAPDIAHYHEHHGYVITGNVFN